MPWFSATIALTCLFTQSERESLIFSWICATLARAFTRLAEPFALRDSTRCARFSFRSSLRKNRGFSITFPPRKTAKSFSPRSMPVSASASASGSNRSAPSSRFTTKLA